MNTHLVDMLTHERRYRDPQQAEQTNESIVQLRALVARNQLTEAQLDSILRELDIRPLEIISSDRPWSFRGTRSLCSPIGSSARATWRRARRPLARSYRRYGAGTSTLLVARVPSRRRLRARHLDGRSALRVAIYGLRPKIIEWRHSMEARMSERKKIERQRSRRPDDADAFLPDPEDGPAHTKDDLAQELAEEFLMSATSGEYVREDELDKEVPEESGGPFVISSGRSEFARGTDGSNPFDAKREALPSPMRGR